MLWLRTHDDVPVYALHNNGLQIGDIKVYAETMPTRRWPRITHSYDTHINLYIRSVHITSTLTSNYSLIYAIIRILISEISYSIVILSKTFFYKCSDFLRSSIIQWEYVGTFLLNKATAVFIVPTFLIRRFSRKRPRT